MLVRKEISHERARRPVPIRGVDLAQTVKFPEIEYPKSVVDSPYTHGRGWAAVACSPSPRDVCATSVARPGTSRDLDPARRRRASCAALSLSPGGAYGWSGGVSTMSPSESRQGLYVKRLLRGGAS